jgi:hypothetical protein
MGKTKEEQIAHLEEVRDDHERRVKEINDEIAALKVAVAVDADDKREG